MFSTESSYTQHDYNRKGMNRKDIKHDVDIRVQNFINGKFCEGGRFIDSYDPSTGRVWAQLPDSGVEVVDEAVRAAKNAAHGWSQTPIAERSQIMMRIADLVEANLDQLAKTESKDQGKPVWLSNNVDIPRTVHNFRFFATAILHHMEKASYMDSVEALSYTFRTPVGVIGLISPWNLPLYLLTFKIAPAIACGNTVVCKPSEMTSVTAWMLCSILQEAGLPSGVVNMVFGSGVVTGDALIRHPDVSALSFTGSTQTATKIREACVSSCKKLSLELGGKNAAIVFDDADMEKCIPTAIRSSFINQGEVCLCSSRIFVQRGVYDEFLRNFVYAARNLKVGDPKAPDTWMGALVSKEHMDKVKRYVKYANEDGGTVKCGEGVDYMNLPQENENGYFVAPTVIAGLKDTARCMQEEIFGPVTCVVPFDTEEEVIQRANNVKYGLSASVWSRDVGRVHRVGQRLQAGVVWANCWLVRDLKMPFGGMKESGVGREGQDDSLEFYTEVKHITLQIS